MGGPNFSIFTRISAHCDHVFLTTFAHSCGQNVGKTVPTKRALGLSSIKIFLMPEAIGASALHHRVGGCSGTNTFPDASMTILDVVEVTVTFGGK